MKYIAYILIWQRRLTVSVNLTFQKHAFGVSLQLASTSFSTVRETDKISVYFRVCSLRRAVPTNSCRVVGRRKKLNVRTELVAEFHYLYSECVDDTCGIRIQSFFFFYILIKRNHSIVQSL